MKVAEMSFLKGATLLGNIDLEFDRISYDSRIISDPERSCFFAFKTIRNDGHRYIMDAFNLGVRSFVVEKVPAELDLNKCGVVVVPKTIEGLKELAVWKRKKLDFPIVGITGSNGKTIVKEWLDQLIGTDLVVGCSPASFNSQLGVAWSIWGLESYMQVGIIEAGISMPGEMDSLASMIQPTLGIFTHVGTAHLENFTSVEKLVEEKCRLFTHANACIYPEEAPFINEKLTGLGFKGEHLTWGTSAQSTLQILDQTGAELTLRYKKEEFTIPLSGSSLSTRNNTLTAVLAALTLGIAVERVVEHSSRLSPLEMRLQKLDGANGASLIADTFNSDLPSLELALDELSNALGSSSKVVILSDILQTGLPPEQLYQKVNRALKLHGVDRLIGVGEEISARQDVFEMAVSCYRSTEALLKEIDQLGLENDSILIKGARPFRFERIVKKLQERIHVSVLEIDRERIIHNLNFYRRKVGRDVKIMAMVKAFGYGTGSKEIAQLLVYHHVDYLGVAYVNEGEALRKQGVRIPIFVLNPDAGAFSRMIEHQLEPEIYSFDQIEQLIPLLKRSEIKSYPIHIMLDTGMHRLGFMEQQLPELIEKLKTTEEVEVKGILTHLAAADDPSMDWLSDRQIQTFNRSADLLSKELGVQPILHICNTAGALRFPDARKGMVRLGIGLYGVASSSIDKDQVLPAATLKTRVSQVRTIPQGEGIGYGHTDKSDSEREIATLPIGYADGYRRLLSNGIGWVKIGTSRCPVVGRVCMDMIMVDVTGLNCQSGDEAILFGDDPTLEEIATLANTIPYEIISGISQRLKRVYI